MAYSAINWPTIIFPWKSIVGFEQSFAQPENSNSMFDGYVIHSQGGLFSIETKLFI